VLANTGLASAVLVSAAYAFDQHNNNNNNVVQCDWGIFSSGRTTSTSKVNFLRRKSQKIERKESADFQILSALEVKDEFQKILLARFLRELHQLALESDKNESSRSVVKLKRKKTKKGELSLRGVDLQNLSTETAAKYQKEMRDGRHFSRDSIIDLANAASAVCLKDDTLIDLRTLSPDKVTIVGDIHGSLKCLDHVLELVGKLDDDPNHCLVFCGDYVDRGSFSLEVFCSLLFLKLSHPNSVFLLRGNHEDIYIASVYGFQEEIRKKFGAVDGDLIWDKMGQLFSSLPYCARTNYAWIVHGGLPSTNFNLSEVEGITPEMRSKVESAVHPTNRTEEILSTLVWSDPSRRKGVHKNPRGAGIVFGPDVAKDFMDRHDLSYIFRSHEPIEAGIDGMPCGDDKYVVTVFSTASYPDGRGTNFGAVVHIDEKTGDMDSVQFEHEREETKNNMSRQSQAHTKFLKEYIAKHRAELEAEFKRHDLDGLVTKSDWATIMSQRLDMPGAAWHNLQPTLAPTTTPAGKYISWMQFLNKYSPNLETLGGEQVNLIHEHEEKIVNLFKILDVDGNGTIDREEFISGIALLNKTCLADEEGFSNPEELFTMFDVDGNGEIDLGEFTSVVAKSKTARRLTLSICSTKIDALKKNHEMLLVAFRFLDRDGSGYIDHDEFRAGIKLINKRLPKEEQFGDPDELFTTIDGDGSGKIDLGEFNMILQQTMSS
jgi:Ca2+-binding EF-hand superfamily protein/diadenosine tetraphosphatase ApaH/serine/threonine PP2A family protein phosphatase